MSSADRVGVPLMKSRESHTTLAPYYAKELNRETVIGEMASKRGGKIICNILKEEEIVELCGSCVFIGEGKLFI